jgi:drug/metabolite transporter (DMT)-like permease
MAPRLWLMLLGLGAVWGASYLFNEIALRELEPAALIEGRFLFGIATLAPLIAARPERRRALAALRTHARPLAVVALLNAALPFFLIAWGQQFIDSGLTGILLASSPLFTALVALAYDRRQRVGGIRLVGIAIGFGGVVLLLGVQPRAGTDALVGALAVVLAALLYSAAGLYVGRRLEGVPRLVVAAGTTAWAVLLTLPAALLQLPSDAPGWETIGALAALGVGGTGIAYLLYFALIGGAGASRAILVNYLIPTAAVLYGVTLLDEPLEATALVGLVLILAGVALGTTARRERVRSRVPRSVGVYSGGSIGRFRRTTGGPGDPEGGHRKRRPNRPLGAREES